jgi:hypothetical protein
LCMAPLCGKWLSPDDRRAWQQAVALLVGLKVRHGLGVKELSAAVGKALYRGAARRNCEDCGEKVSRGGVGGVWGGGGGVLVPCSSRGGRAVQSACVAVPTPAPGTSRRR